MQHREPYQAKGVVGMFVSNQQQARSRLDRILDQVTTASKIVSKHRTAFTKPEEGREPSINQNLSCQQLSQLEEQSKLRISDRLHSPSSLETWMNSRCEQPTMRIELIRNKIHSKLDPKAHTMAEEQHRSESKKLEAWEQRLNSLQSKVQEARFEMGRVMNHSGKSELLLRNSPRQSYSKVRDSEEQNMNNTKTVVKVASSGTINTLLKQQPLYFSPYYIPELIRSINQRHSLAVQHVRESIGIFKYFAGFKRKPELMPKPFELSQNLRFKDKKTLVFDLDETLIHYSESGNKYCDISLSIIMPNGENVQAHVGIRPYAMTLLSNLKDRFELMVFTASEKTYANTVINFLDPDNNIFQHRLYSEHCYQHPQGPVKDLQAVSRRAENIVLIDNSPYSYGYQQDSAIPILPFYGDQSDCQLKRLEEYLYRLEHAPDIRQLNRQIFKLQRYVDFVEPKPLITELYMDNR